MPLLCLGLSHHTAPTEVRERHAFHGSEVSEALITLLDYEAVREAAIVSTCNRLEVYAEVESVECGIDQLKQFLVNFRHGDVPYDMEPYIYTLSGSLAANHLFRVATGLDSMLIGEAEILGQVRDAYGGAQRAGCFGPNLHHLFRDAINVGKAARTRTHIGGNSISIATAAVAVAREHVGSLGQKSVLLVGAGQMGVKSAKRLKIEGVGQMTIANRTLARAEELVTNLGMGRAIELHEMEAALVEADVAITSTVSPTFVLTPAIVERVMAQRSNRPLCIVDIAVPRNVDPVVASIPGVRVVDIDQLGAPVELAFEHRRDAIPMVEAIVEEAVARWVRWYASRETIPVLTALSRRAESIRLAEVERVFARCGTLSERDRRVILGMSLRIVSKLMHPAFSTIREADTARIFMHADVIDELFALGLHERPQSGE